MRCTKCGGLLFGEDSCITCGQPAPVMSRRNVDSYAPVSLKLHEAARILTNPPKPTPAIAQTATKPKPKPRIRFVTAPGGRRVKDKFDRRKLLQF